MDDFQTIQEIVNESVRNSSYITVIISSAIFIIYTLIIKLVDYFKAKNKTRPLIEMANAIKENTANIVKLNGVLDRTLQEHERKKTVQCEKAIEAGFKAFSFRISQECSAIIAHNNIDTNKELIITNVNKTVSAEYYKLFSSLSSYEIKDVNVSTKLKEEWIKEISDNLIAIIYNGQPDVSRIIQVTNRLAIYSNEYSTYVNNKIFNT